MSAIVKAISLFGLIVWTVNTVSFARDVDLKRSIPASIQNDFRAVEDSLCFANHGFEAYAEGKPYLTLLAKIADREGACQGMVGVAAAVKTRVIFRPEEPKMNKKQVRQQIRRAVHLHQNKCSKKVYIDGHRNLRELCQEQEAVLKQRSLLYNLSLARKEILKYSWSFFNEKVLADPAKASEHLKEHLVSLYKRLKSGDYPLMMVRRHVTMVVGMQVTKDAKGNPREIVIQHYDPNTILSSSADFYSRRYMISEDGKTVTGTLIWDISPAPMTSMYCAVL